MHLQFLDGETGSL